MKPPDREARGKISLWIRCLISGAVLWHFVSLFFAAVAPAIPGFPPSLLVTRIHEQLFRTPLEFLGLTNPHRYYAPGVSAFTQAWFRATLADGTIRWMELPGPRDPILPARCQRRLGIAMALQASTVASSDEPGLQVLTPLGCVLASSYARHLADEFGRIAGQVTEVQIYQVVHRIRLPDEVQRGWSATDLRLYAPRYLGTYSPDGRAKVNAHEESATRRAPNIPMSLFAATMLREDVWPALDHTRGESRVAQLKKLDLPVPIRDLLKRAPALAEPGNAADLRVQLVQSVEAQERSGPSPRRDPGEW